MGYFFAYSSGQRGSVGAVFFFESVAVARLVGETVQLPLLLTASAVQSSAGWFSAVECSVVHCMRLFSRS